MTALTPILQLQAAVSKFVLGQEALVDRLLIALLVNGNVLLEGPPGLGKTRAVKSLAQQIEAGYSRIQFTPDLLSSDVIGKEHYVVRDGRNEPLFHPGPLFQNLVLVDHINRAPAKVQAALLEAMDEQQITVAGKKHQLPALFMVFATQNPTGCEGTYPLSAAQRDRFLMQVKVDYPAKADELSILHLMKKEEGGQVYDKTDPTLRKTNQKIIITARESVRQVHVSAIVEQYIVDLIDCSRFPEQVDEQLAAWLESGASSRGTLALDKVARADAWLKGKDFVSPDDVQAVIYDVLRHRLTLSPQAHSSQVSVEQVIDRLIQVVAIG